MVLNMETKNARSVAESPTRRHQESGDAERGADRNNIPTLATPPRLCHACEDALVPVCTAKN